MPAGKLNIIILGLSITSAWGNGHATTYRGLVRELTRRGHNVLFLERDMPWYAANRDICEQNGSINLYSSLEELISKFSGEVRQADLVIVGSYVPDGKRVGEWVIETAHGLKCFYDIDTPVTLARLENGNGRYISPELVRNYDMYLSFTGGPILKTLTQKFGARFARAFYCSFDPALYCPEPTEISWDLGYMGTYSRDRQPVLDSLLLDCARSWPEGRFVVAGPLYPREIKWPANVGRVDHVNPPDHRKFYSAQRFTLNVTRADMVRAGHSPSVRLFEAAGCGTPIISDYWEGLELLFKPGEEILISRSAGETLEFIRGIPESERIEIGRRGRRRVMSEHTAGHRALQLEVYINELVNSGPHEKGRGK